MEAYLIKENLESEKTLLKSKFYEFYKIQLSKKEDLDFSLLLNKVFYYFDLTHNNKDLHDYLERIYNNIHGLEFIKEQMNANDIDEYVFCDETRVMKDVCGKLTSFNITNLNHDEYQLALETMAYKNKIDWNYKSPFSSFRLSIRNIPFRATLIHHSLTNNKKSRLFLRNIREKPYSLSDFGLNINEILKIKSLIKEKTNIIVTGATSSGKTSLLRSLLNEITNNEHVIIMEDTYELSINRKNFTHLLSKNSEGKSLKDFCSYSLRMRPDRCVLGEIRSEEVTPFILSMNTGHKGMMASLHANGPRDTIQRLATLFSLYSNSNQISYTTIMKLLCQSMDIIIHMENKKISSITKVIGLDDQVPIIQNLYDINESK